MLTSRMIRNRMLREIGIQPTESYHTAVGPGDVVKVVIVAETATVPCMAVGTIESVIDHGWYSTVFLKQDNGTTRTIEIYRDGPQEYGCVECRILEKRHSQQQPHIDRDGTEWQRLQKRARRERRARQCST